MLANLASPITAISRLRGRMGLNYSTEITTIDRLGVMTQTVEKMLMKMINE